MPTEQGLSRLFVGEAVPSVGLRGGAVPAIGLWGGDSGYVVRISSGRFTGTSKYCHQKNTHRN